jgi:hypothetical protein
MKVAPVSADLLIRLALVAAGLGLAYYAWRKASGVVEDAFSTALDAASTAAGNVADAIIVGTNPVNPDNWANRAATAIGDTLVSDTGPGRNADGSWTLGGAAFDLLNPGWSDNLSGLTAIDDPAPPRPTGGAAFGWFPQLGRQQGAAATIAARGRVVGGL